MKWKGRRQSRKVDDKRPGTARHALSEIDRRNTVRKIVKSGLSRIPKDVRERMKENDKSQKKLKKKMSK